MSILLIAATLALGSIGLAFVFLYRTLSTRQNPDLSVDRCLILSPETYRPMTRLLQEKDFRFLAAQPGFSPQLGRRFRATRRQVFRGYLRILRKDFGRAASVCWILMLRASEDRQDLAKILIRSHLMFALAVFAVEGRLLLHAAGVGTVDVRALLESLETMQSQVRLVLTPPRAATAIG
jgi:hypothetical protein